MAEITAEHVTQAIAVKRGQRRLRDLPVADRTAVAHVLQTTSDAKLATVIEGTRPLRSRAIRVAHARYTSFRTR